ncbi:hypothetical protein VP01_2352g2 [Puccinia sorghi]|uniref:Uncharacterized protein n=1 Tax=Puccinia sorghi TaxID=27349 RepID=A0A0L6V7F0_9BASI|nr:hypothetical protein VP01_2352g2 [Puccinia sorghi]
MAADGFSSSLTQIRSPRVYGSLKAPLHQVTDGYENRISYLEEVVCLLLTRSRPALNCHPDLQSTMKKPAHVSEEKLSFHYSIHWGLEPLVSTKVGMGKIHLRQQKLLFDWRRDASTPEVRLDYIIRLAKFFTEPSVRDSESELKWCYDLVTPSRTCQGFPQLGDYLQPPHPCTFPKSLATSWHQGQHCQRSPLGNQTCSFPSSLANSNASFTRTTANDSTPLFASNDGLNNPIKLTHSLPPSTVVLPVGPLLLLFMLHATPHWGLNQGWDFPRVIDDEGYGNGG